MPGRKKKEPPEKKPEIPRRGHRAIWKGAISFGLVNIPVSLYTGSQDKELKFVLLHNKDLSEIRYSRVCKVEGKEVPWNEIVKGYEFERGNFVVLNDEDFVRADLKKNKTIEILSFINEEEIDSIYYVKPYYLEPDKNAEKAYSILREALRKSGKVGLAKYIIRNREHLAVVKAVENMLVLNEMRYYSEVLQPSDLNLPPILEKTGTKEVDMAMELINQLTEPFHPERYKDTYVQEMKEIINQKARGRPIHPRTAEAPATKVHDIMALLQASLKETKKPGRKRKSA